MDLSSTMSENEGDLETCELMVEVDSLKAVFNKDGSESIPILFTGHY